MNVTEAADLLLAAELTHVDTSPLTDVWPELDVATAYQIQDETLRRRLSRGEKLVGVKLGLTSVAKQRTMGIDRPLVAWLTDAMLVPAGGVVGDGLIHPRVEPEIVFVLKSGLRGPGVSYVDALAAVGSVYGGIEVIDSRFADFRFQLPDVIADNASSARFSLGPVAVDSRGLDLSLEACVFTVDGTIDTATGSAVQGHPVEALTLAANVLAERGLGLEPGWIVMTGGMTDAMPFSAGSAATAEFTHLGTVVLRGGSAPSH
ncbi:MAG: 2-keto-4-pentenoate hydratase [Acidimicrobiales bacterium]